MIWIVNSRFSGGEIHSMFSAMLCNTFLPFSIMTQLNTVYYGKVSKAFSLSMSTGASLLMLIMGLYQTLTK